MAAIFSQSFTRLSLFTVEQEDIMPWSSGTYLFNQGTISYFPYHTNDISVRNALMAIIGIIQFPHPLHTTSNAYCSTQKDQGCSSNTIFNKCRHGKYYIISCNGSVSLQLQWKYLILRKALQMKSQDVLRWARLKSPELGGIIMNLNSVNCLFSSHERLCISTNIKYSNNLFILRMLKNRC